MREYVRFSRSRNMHSFIAELFDMLDMLTVVIFCFILLFTYVLQMATVQGTSMVPTLENEDKLLVRVAGSAPECGDIVIINSVEATVFDENGGLCTQEGLNKVIVKRVIAQAGQTINIDFEAGIVYLEGEPLQEDYINSLTTNPVSGAFEYPITIPEGYYFVMGDNRDISKDSRYPDVGLIHESAIIGTVFFRYAPWENAGFL